MDVRFLVSNSVKRTAAFGRLRSCRQGLLSTLLRRSPRSVAVTQRRESGHCVPYIRASFFTSPHASGTGDVFLEDPAH